MSFRLFLSGGPADEVRERRPEWTLRDVPGLTGDALDQIPDHVWLSRIEWGDPEWRVRLTPEMIRGKSALYWLERERDESPKQTVSGAYMYTHVPDQEIGEYVSEREALAAGGMFRSQSGGRGPGEGERR